MNATITLAWWYYVVVLLGFWASAYLGIRLYKSRVAADLAELQRWRLAWSLHYRWLCVRPEARLVLENLKAHADGQAYDISWPPKESGPWDVGGLREVLFRHEEMATARIESKLGAAWCGPAPS